MDVAVVCVGDELLDGRIRDRHTTTLARRLQSRGGRLVEARLSRDDEEAIAETLDELAARADAIVVTGGLGPTDDDRTRSAAARWADRSLDFDDATLDRLEQRFAEHGFEFTPNNRRQCYFPDGADILPSDVGSAAGFRLDHRETTAWFFPGVPREFEWFLDAYFVPRLEDGARPNMAARELTFLGLGESGLETRIDAAATTADELDVSLRYLADAPLVTVHLQGESTGDVELVREQILDEIGDWLVTDGGRSLSETIGTHLDERDETVTTAESCTAGWLSKNLTGVPGSSAWFEYGFVTYANEAKRRMLGVDSETLTAHGAVSPETVREMAGGARRYADATYALAISGIAGPSGGTEAKPVGTVDIGLATPTVIYSRRFQFPDRGRDNIRSRSVRTAAGLLVWHLTDRWTHHQIDGPFDPDEILASDGD